MDERIKVVIRRRWLVSKETEPDFYHILRVVYTSGSVLVIEGDPPWEEVRERMQRSRAVYVWLRRLCELRNHKLESVKDG